MSDTHNSGCAYPSLRHSLSRGVDLAPASLEELLRLVREGSVEDFLCLQRAVKAGRMDLPCATSAHEEGLPWPPPTD